MQFTMREYLSEMERRRDEMERAQKERLYRQLPRRESLMARGTRRSLARLGSSLTRWGEGLQRRYAATTGSFSPIEPCRPGHCQLARPLQIAVPVRAD